MSLQSIEHSPNHCYIHVQYLRLFFDIVIIINIKQDFFQNVAVSVVLYGCTTWTLTKCFRGKARQELHQDAACYFEEIQIAVLYKTASVLPLTSHLLEK